MAEVKQTNFRINEDAANAFRAYCEENGWNQAQGFDHLIEILELNQAKAAMPEQSTDIEQFEMYQKKMLEAFLHNLAVTAETEERIREQFRAALDQKDQTIRDLQEKTAAQAAEIDDAKAAKADAEKATAAAEKEVAQARKDADAAQSLAAEKGRTNEMLTGKLTEAEEKLSGYDDLRKSETDLKGQVSDLTHQLDLERAEGKHKEEAAEAAIKRAEAAEQKASDQAAEIDGLKTEIAAAKQATIDAKKDAERQLSDTQKDAALHETQELEKLRQELNATIQTLREEKAGLQARVDILQEQIAEMRKPEPKD